MSDAATPTALVLGASGQDGSYLVRHLDEAGHRVIAVGRDLAARRPDNWRRAGVNESVERRDLDYFDREAVARLVAETAPGAIYVLAGQSSVRLSFVHPAETIRSHTLPILAVLEAVRTQGRDIHVVYASSTDCFGTIEGIGDERHTYQPQSPYGVGKQAGTMAVRTYREAFGMRCSTALLSNHESILRSEDFLFGKILNGIADIAQGRRDTIITGSLAIERDWGYAPEFAAAMAAIADLDAGAEMVIATGRTVVLRDAVHALFVAFGLDPARHLREELDMGVPTVIQRQQWDPAKARRLLGWVPPTGFPALAERLHADWLAATDNAN